MDKLQIFSKSSKDPFFRDEFKSENYSLNGKFELEIPILKAIEASMKYTASKGKENSDLDEDIEIKIMVPVRYKCILGINKISQAIISLGEKLASIKKHSDCLQIGNALKVAGKNLYKTQNIKTLKFSNDLSDKLLTTDSIGTTIYLTKITKTPDNLTLTSLPDQALCIKDQDEWILKNIKISNISTKSLFNLSNTRENYINVLGNKTISYVQDRYNIFKLGLYYDSINHEKSQENSLWNLFKQKHINEIKKIIKNISNDGSNSQYEIQCIYNDLIKFNKNNVELVNNCQDVVRELIQACKKFDGNPSSDNWNDAIKALEKFLDLQFYHLFITHQSEFFYKYQ